MADIANSNEEEELRKAVAAILTRRIRSNGIWQAIMVSLAGAVGASLALFVLGWGSWQLLSDIIEERGTTAWLVTVLGYGTWQLFMLAMRQRQVRMRQRMALEMLQQGYSSWYLALRG